MFRLLIFRPAYNRTGPFYVRTIWDPTLFTYKVHTLYVNSVGSHIVRT